AVGIELREKRIVGSFARQWLVRSTGESAGSKYHRAFENASGIGVSGGIDRDRRKGAGQRAIRRECAGGARPQLGAVRGKFADKIRMSVVKIGEPARNNCVACGV